MKKLFVSVPMKGRTEDEIRTSIEKMHEIAEVFMNEKLELIDSYVKDNPPEDGQTSIWYLSKSIEKLSSADVFVGITEVYDWNGCFIESQIAQRYGIKSFSVPGEYVIENYYKLAEANYQAIRRLKEGKNETR